MKTFLNDGWFFRLALILSFVLAGCGAVNVPIYSPTLVDGQVIPTQVTTVLNGIMGATTGLMPGSRIYQDPSGTRLLFTWPLAGGQGWAFMGNSIEGLQEFIIEKSGGNLGSLNTWTTIKNTIEAQGWKIVAAEAITPLIRVGATVYFVSMTTIGTRTSIFGLSLTDSDVFQNIKSIINPSIDA